MNGPSCTFGLRGPAILAIKFGHRQMMSLDDFARSPRSIQGSLILPAQTMRYCNYSCQKENPAKLQYLRGGEKKASRSVLTCFGRTGNIHKKKQQSTKGAMSWVGIEILR